MTGTVAGGAQIHQDTAGTHDSGMIHIHYIRKLLMENDFHKIAFP